MQHNKAVFIRIVVMAGLPEVVEQARKKSVSFRRFAAIPLPVTVVFFEGAIGFCFFFET